MGQRFCTACGAVVSAGLKFCEQCGSPVVPDSAGPVPQPVIPVGLPTSSPQVMSSPQGGKKTSAVTIIAGIFIILFIILFFLGAAFIFLLPLL